MPLGNYFRASQAVMDFHVSHIVMVALLITKEISVYYLCVRRAADKLKKESKGISISDIAKLDGFHKTK